MATCAGLAAARRRDIETPATVARVATVGACRRSRLGLTKLTLETGDESALDSRRSGYRYSFPASTWAHNPPDHRPAADFRATRARRVTRRAAPGRSLFLAGRGTRSAAIAPISQPSRSASVKPEPGD